MAARCKEQARRTRPTPLPWRILVLQKDLVLFPDGRIGEGIPPVRPAVESLEVEDGEPAA